MKEIRKMKIVDAIYMKDLQNFKIQVNVLNPVHIDIENDKLWNFVTHYKGKNFP